VHTLIGILASHAIGMRKGRNVDKGIERVVTYETLCDGLGRARRNWMLASLDGMYLLKTRHSSQSDAERLLSGVAFVACAVR
jgi:hypothetical protein